MAPPKRDRSTTQRLAEREQRLAKRRHSMSSAASLKRTAPLQTLDRGLRALTMISQHEDGLSVAELSTQLGVHRAIGYRLAATLESHGFIFRRPNGQLLLGARLLTLAYRFEPQLGSVARPLLTQLAQATHAAAFISMAQGDMCVPMSIAEPEAGLFRITYRVGGQHPLTVGAAGIAILAGRRARPGDSKAVREARRLGYSVTRGQLQRGAVGVASALHAGKGAPLPFEGSVGVVAFDDLDVAAAAKAVIAYSRRIAQAIASKSSVGSEARAPVP